MGMSASQARMLSLTSRLSDLEYQAQSISNSKIRLADRSEQASENYEDALNKQKLTVMSSDSSTYVDASAYNLTTYGAVSSTDKQRFLKDASGRVIVTTGVGNSYDNSQNKNSTSYQLKQEYPALEDYLRSNDALGYATEQEAQDAGLNYDAKAVTYYTNMYNGLEGFLNSLGYTSNPDNADQTLSNDDGAVSAYTNVFNQIAKNGYDAVGDANMKDSEWLYSQLNAGNIFLSEWDDNGGTDGKGDWVNVSWSSGDVTLKTDSDSTQTAKAEAEYNTAMAQIQSQDKKYDLQLKEIDTEHSAIQTEIDSVKKVIDKNIERSFKTFNA